jgi:hypothetical protein
VSTRAVPYLCPFCGEEDLRPVETAETAGPPGGSAGARPAARWECRGCLRVFSLAFHGLSRPTGPPGEDVALASAAQTRPWNPDAWGGAP